MESGEWREEGEGREEGTLKKAIYLSDFNISRRWTSCGVSGRKDNCLGAHGSGTTLQLQQRLILDCLHWC